MSTQDKLGDPPVVELKVIEGKNSLLTVANAMEGSIFKVKRSILPQGILNSVYMKLAATSEIGILVLNLETLQPVILRKQLAESMLIDYVADEAVFCQRDPNSIPAITVHLMPYTNPEVILPQGGI